MINLFRFFMISAVVIVSTTAAPAQTYKSIDFPGAVGTSLNGINSEGTQVGSYTDISNLTHGFLLQKGVFKSFDPPGSSFTIPHWISPRGTIVGGYNDASGSGHGFILFEGEYQIVDYPGASYTTLTGLTPSGELAGYYCFGACLQLHSFLRFQNGIFFSFDPPGSVSSDAGTVNPSDVVVGDYTDSAGVGHGYTYRERFTTIDFPGATSTFPAANNPEGAIVGEYNDAADNGHGFLLEQGHFRSFDFPEAIFTYAAGINPEGFIVGAYLDSSGNEHGFIRTPARDSVSGPKRPLDDIRNAYFRAGAVKRRFQLLAPRTVETNFPAGVEVSSSAKRNEYRAPGRSRRWASTISRSSSVYFSLGG